MVTPSRPAGVPTGLRQALYCVAALVVTWLLLVAIAALIASRWACNRGCKKSNKIRKRRDRCRVCGYSKLTGRTGCSNCARTIRKPPSRTSGSTW